ncbi:hypothetical protein BN193_02355 [Lactococcus raffinolactis 4877]|nr:hypothetical protein BN193_02355 [Lactococcus raffinolactis 4877]
MPKQYPFGKKHLLFRDKLIFFLENYVNKKADSDNQFDFLSLLFSFSD